jgi:hypothetical protein
MTQLKQVAGFIGLFLLGSCWAAQGAITCSTSDYHGTYAFMMNGAWLTSPATSVPAGPFTMEGSFTSDGQGNVTVQSIVSLNGSIQSVDTKATYTLNSNCTISVLVNFPAPLGIAATFQGVMSADNRQMTLLLTNPAGTSIIGTHLKQFTEFCGGSEFNGAYAIDLGGTLLGSSALAGKFHRIGRLVADGSGNFTATTLVNYAGQLTPESFSGTYVLSGDCSLKLNYRSGSGSSAQSIAISGLLVDGGSTVVTMITTPGWAVSGTLKAQQ